jgi:hypothetical protein
MIEMTEPLRQALDENPNEPIQIVDPRTRQTYVLLRSDIYERIKTLVSDDDDLAGVDVGRLIADAMREDDADDPLLESYQKYKRPK